MSPAAAPASPDVWVWVPFEVDKKFDGFRIDRFLAERLIGYSRNKVQKILTEARVHRNGVPAKANSKVKTSDHIQIAYLRRPEAPLPADMRMPILFEDEQLIIVDKPADLLSHPTDKIANRTVLGLLRQLRPDLKKVHLMHRLDRETSGVLALGKDPLTAKYWTKAMTHHEIQKEYVAIVHGVPHPSEGVIDRPIGAESKSIRLRQWVDVPGAVPAVTHYRVISRFRPGLNLKRSASLDGVQSSIVRVFPKTGRLHQIRVHLASIGHPLLGDPLYTGEGELFLKMIEQGLSEAERIEKLGFPRVALHATVLTFQHPKTGIACRVESPLPVEFNMKA